MPTTEEIIWEDLSQLASSSSSSASPLPSDSDGSTPSAVGLSVAPSRRSSFSYCRLPDPSLRLSILRLDSTSFEVKVSRTANVLRLKMAVEDVFRDLSEKTEGGGNIFWSHVWGHFCLCFKDYKLLDDRKSLKEYGIKDGDQLRFIRHLSVNQNPNKKRLKTYEVVQRNVMLLTGPEENSNEKNDYDSLIRIHYRDYQNYDDEHGDLLGKSNSKMTHMWRGCFSCSSLGSSKKSRSEERARHRRSGSYF
ncbi:Uncharacterized protein M6B38_248540 [Iris pallida]|uniref:SNRNP25 ubiquitin-like domain-containing protein n=1 Tax=Iris pallida TaxID=29817 RepID=A0AAX6DGK4_IRIPA|nr:Uncharacterized protein M6B38_248540 [Iris pallida]